MAVRSLFLLIFFALLFSCSEPYENIKNDYGDFSKDSTLLATAYNGKAEGFLKLFFTKWEARSQRNIPLNLPPVFEEAYMIFEYIYNRHTKMFEERRKGRNNISNAS